MKTTANTFASFIACQIILSKTAQTRLAAPVAQLVRNLPILRMVHSVSFSDGDWRHAGAYAEISWEEARDISIWRSANNEHSVGGGLNCVSWRLSAHSAKFKQMHAAVAIMAADIHVPQYPEGGHEADFWQTIAEINILLFLRESTRIGAPCLRYCDPWWWKWWSFESSMT